MTRHELICEITRLRRLADDWQAWYACQQQYLHANGQPALPSERPCEGPERDAAADSPLASPAAPSSGASAPEA